MRAGIIDTAVRFGICKHILLDEAGFSMGAAPWNGEMNREVQALEEFWEDSAGEGAAVSAGRSVKTISTAIRFGICKQLLFEDDGISADSLPWTQEMKLKAKALNGIMELAGTA